MDCGVLWIFSFFVVKRPTLDQLFHYTVSIQHFVYPRLMYFGLLVIVFVCMSCPKVVETIVICACQNWQKF